MCNTQVINEDYVNYSEGEKPLNNEAIQMSIIYEFYADGKETAL